jgi:hypothetical protein
LSFSPLCSDLRATNAYFSAIATEIFMLEQYGCKAQPLLAPERSRLSENFTVLKMPKNQHIENNT